MKYIILFIIFMGFSSATQAEPMKFSCVRFKSNCTGAACEQLYIALRKDVNRRILTLRKIQRVDYNIANGRATEYLKSQREKADEDTPLVIEYKHVKDSLNKIILSNYDKHGSIKEKAEIEPASGFYRYYLIHTDGSIKGVPVGEPYMAYFGWCTYMNKAQDEEGITKSTPSGNEATKAP